jgi:hypothetical protein
MSTCSQAKQLSAIAAAIISITPRNTRLSRHVLPRHVPLGGAGSTDRWDRLERGGVGGFEQGGGGSSDGGIGLDGGGGVCEA